MKNVAIIGRGNVACHLYEALRDKADVVLVNPHSLDNLPANPDIILISVKDDAIPEIVRKLRPGSYILAHTAGSVSVSTLAGPTPHTGVLYPLQTFTKNQTLDYSEIPIFLEGSDPSTLQELETLASLFSKDIRHADSEARRHLHLASVFACNFSNALAAIAADILKDSGISFDAILPLMKQTIKKLETLTPREAQTGPAIRNDRKVIDAHINMLNDNPEAQQIYKNISNFIQNSCI